ncbi:PTS sugar transporter subunit IIB [Tannockella kyphosi]|uniref:PTS sugar transporter subunit IIB n=1 Tax=Tannockella kyphosi TaxID=2899121 RepID=UPI0020122A5E|nr:PTS sugar transporter subunit IIB [Tannockella kyphosi]
MRILLICAGGFSTSLLVSKMIDHANAIGDSPVIEAHAVSDLGNLIDDFDVVLLGPQIAHKLKSVKETYGHLGKPIAVIEHIDYGLVRGKETYEKAVKMIKENN